jgi:hypothetical protein
MAAQHQSNLAIAEPVNGWRGPLTCRCCGHEQRTRAQGDNTRCRECGAHIYVPAHLRHAAVIRPYRTPGPKPKPRADVAPTSTTTTRRYDPRTDPVVEAAAFINAGMKMIADHRAQTHQPAAAVPVVTPAAALVPPRTIPPIDDYRITVPRGRCPKCVTGTGHCDLPGCPL